MKSERKCGKCKHYKPFARCKDVGYCTYDKISDHCLYESFEDCDIKEPNGFEPKEGEQE